MNDNYDDGIEGEWVLNKTRLARELECVERLRIDISYYFYVCSTGGIATYFNGFPHLPATETDFWLYFHSSHSSFAHESDVETTIREWQHQWGLNDTFVPMMGRMNLSQTQNTRMLYNDICQEIHNSISAMLTVVIIFMNIPMSA